MSNGNALAYQLITNPTDLQAMVENLSAEPVIAVDTESNSLYAFQEQVCLLQFSTVRSDYLVDPLAIKDLSSLAPVFSNQEIEKVFHAAEYDIICLKRDFGFQFVNLFDTMIAARILGRQSFGLSSLLEAEFKVKTDKRFQRANWGQRPLPKHLLDYASQDTHYLIPLRNRLAAELEDHDLVALAEEDFTRLTKVEANHNNPSGSQLSCWKVRGASDLSPQEIAVLQELCQYRISIARNNNRPLFKVFLDRTLVNIAQKTPGSLHELSQVPGMSPGQVRRHGHQILQAVQRGRRAEPIFPSHPQRPSDAYLRRIERLQQWRKDCGASLHVPSDVILPRDLMEELAKRNPLDEEALEAVLDSVPYRLEHFGSQILEVLHPSKDNSLPRHSLPNLHKGRTK